MPPRSQNDPLSDPSVNVVSKSLVNPQAREGGLEDIPLGPLDALSFVVVPTNVIFVYLNDHVDQTTDAIIDPCLLKIAFSRLLDFYPVFSGRLREDAITGRRTIEQIGVAGAEFIEATCSLRLDEIAKENKNGRVYVSQLPGGSNALICDFEPFSKEFVYQNALCSLQHTKFACGGVVLGFHVMHTVCDAGGLFCFTKHLTEIYRKLFASAVEKLGDCENWVSAGPEMWRDLSRDIELEHIPQAKDSYLADWDKSTKDNEKTRLKNSFKTPLFYTKQVETGGTEDFASVATAEMVVGKEIEFCSAALDKLKQMCTDSPGATKSEGDNNDIGSKTTFSSYEALCAYLAVSIYKARQTLHQRNPECCPCPPTTFFYNPVNLRKRILAELSEYYLFNAVIGMSGDINEQHLSAANFHQVATFVHNLIYSDSIRSGEHVRESLKWVASHTSYNDVASRYERKGVQISSWCTYRTLDGMEFPDSLRLGSVILPHVAGPVFSPTSFVDGLVLLLNGAGSNRDDPRSQTAYVTLQASLWEELEKDEFFASLIAI